VIDGAGYAQAFDNKESDNTWWNHCTYNRTNNVSMNLYVDKVPASGYLCLRNMNLSEPLKVKIEILAEVGWGRESKQKMYNEIKNRIAVNGSFSEEELKTFCGCFVKSVTSKPIQEVREMLDYEIEDWMKSVISECADKTTAK